MKPRVFKSTRYRLLWAVDPFDYSDITRYFSSWREAFDWAYAHATQHEEER